MFSYALLCYGYHVVELSLGGLLSKLFKDFHSIHNSDCHGKRKEKNKKKILDKICWPD